jgi:ribosomal protein L7/L12
MQSNDSERIADLERRVDYLIRYLGIDPAHIASGVGPAGFPAGLPAGLDVAPADERADAELGPVYDAIRAGKQVNAIKLYRTLTGASLAEAKYAVDSIARGL